MRRTVTIHAGLPKCGSTALQLVLASNRPRLLESGVFYPTIERPDGKGPLPNHLRLADDMARSSKAGTPSPMLQQIVEEFNSTKADHLLLSAETIAARAQRYNSSAIGSLFDDFEVNMIVFFRRRDFLLLSAYKQMVQMRQPQYSDTFSTYLVQDRTARVSLATQFTALQSAFSADHIDAISLDDGPSDTVQLAGEILGLPLSQYEVDTSQFTRRIQTLEAAGQPINASGSDSRIVFLAACNETGVDFRAIRDIQLALAEADPAPHEPNLSLLSPDLSARILRHSEPDRRELEERFAVTLGPYKPVEPRGDVEYREKLTRDEYQAYLDWLRPMVRTATVREFRGASEPVNMIA